MIQIGAYYFSFVILISFSITPFFDKHLSGFIQPKHKNALNNFLEANNTPFSPKKHGSDNDFDFEKIVDKPTVWGLSRNDLALIFEQSFSKH